MHILCLGLNHRTADLNLRERLAFSETEVKAALSRLGCGHGSEPAGISELAILSTCNRVELYAVSPGADFEPLEAFLAELRGVPLEHFQAKTSRLLDQDAVLHLLGVAAGLDSLVLGEPQILGQVTQAFEQARGQNAIGPVLSRLFQAALRAGKRARTETAIGHNPSSIASVAVRLAEGAVPNLAAAQVVVVGAGEMAELAVEVLCKRGVHRVLVVNRTLERARGLADRWAGEAETFERLPAAIRRADVLITSTGAPHSIISKELLAASRPGESPRPLAIIDIAVPRDVDPAAGELPGVRLYDIDDLESRLQTSLAQRAREVPLVESILQEEAQDFAEYLVLLDVFPVIAELHQQAEAIRQAELEKTLRHFPDLDEAGQERLQAMTQALVKKLLHAPISQLRASAGGPHGPQYAAAARTLFGLESGHTQT